MYTKYTIATDGAATAVAQNPTMFSNLTTGVIDSIAAKTDVAYSGAALRHIAVGNMVLGSIVGNYLANRAWTKAQETGSPPRRVLGFFTV